MQPVKWYEQQHIVHKDMLKQEQKNYTLTSDFF